MLTNARGAAVLAGTVTKATFAGLPIVGCCVDYGSGGVAQPFLDFADSLGVPAIVTDVAHDGDGPTPALAAALKLYSKWFVPGLPGKPYLGPDGVTPSALCGPILTLSSPLFLSSPSKADMVARSLRNFRRNHKLGLGPSALYVPRGNDPDLDPLPPVYLDRFVAYDSAGGQEVYYSGSDDPAPYTSLPYYHILKSCWQSGNWTLSGDQSIWPSLPTSPKVSMALGIDALRSAQLPERHFFASLAPLLLLPRYAGGGSISFCFTPSMGGIPGTWGTNTSIGLTTSTSIDILPAPVPADGEVYGLVVQGLGAISGATTIKIRRAAGGISISGGFYGFEETFLQASLSGAAGADPDHVVQVLQGDLLVATCTNSWACHGASVVMQFRPKLRTVTGNYIL